jgi:hypothetical protein
VLRIDDKRWSPAKTKHYGYDGVDRLTSVTGDEQSYYPNSAYAYDAMGNRTTGVTLENALTPPQQTFRVARVTSGGGQATLRCGRQPGRQAHAN